MKKIISILILGVSVVALSACKGDKPPVFGNVGPAEVTQYQTFDPRAGVTATDPEDGDLTASITIEGDVDTTVYGTYQLKYSVTDKKKHTVTADRLVTVKELLYNLAQYTNGIELGILPSTEKAKFFAAAEKYLVDKGYGGIPLYSGASAVMYSDRTQLFSNDYNAVLGFGTEFSDFSADDSTVKFEGESTGVAGQKTFRSSYVTDPKALFSWVTDDAVSADFIDLYTGGLYDFFWSADKSTYVVSPALAKADPVAINGNTINGKSYSTKWQIPIKDGLEWTFHPQADLSVGGFDVETGKVLNADDWVNTWKFALTKKWFRSNSGGTDIISQGVINAGAFQNDPTDANWNKVGIKSIAGQNTIEIEFSTPKSQFDIKYLLAGGQWPALNIEYVNALGGTTKEGGNYGKDPKTVCSSGVYYFDTWTSGQELTFKKNDKYPLKDLYKYSGYTYRQIPTTPATFQEFLAGRLDTASVPSDVLQNYANDPRLKKTADPTTWRLMVNSLGTKEAQAKAAAKYGVPLDKTWVPKPILKYPEMLQALFYGVNRTHLANDTAKGTRLGQVGLFSDTYMIDAESGLGVRDTPEGLAVVSDYKNSKGEYDGYVPDLAVGLFTQAVGKAIAAGEYTAGTEASPTVIELKLYWASSGNATGQAYVAELVKGYNDLLIDIEHWVKINITVEDVAFPNNYYDHMMVANMDLGVGGISGSLLNAPSFLDVFCDDNRGGFTLNWGIDTSTANINVRYIGLDGTEKNETWSFNAITAALNGKAYVYNGAELTAFDTAKAAIDFEFTKDEQAAPTTIADSDALTATGIVGNADAVESIKTAYGFSTLEYKIVTDPDGNKYFFAVGKDSLNKYSVISYLVTIIYDTKDKAYAAAGLEVVGTPTDASAKTGLIDNFIKQSELTAEGAYYTGGYEFYIVNLGEDGDYLVVIGKIGVYYEVYDAYQVYLTLDEVKALPTEDSEDIISEEAASPALAKYLITAKKYDAITVSNPGVSHKVWTSSTNGVYYYIAYGEIDGVYVVAVDPIVIYSSAAYAIENTVIDGGFTYTSSSSISDGDAVLTAAGFATKEAVATALGLPVSVIGLYKVTYATTASEPVSSTKLIVVIDIPEAEYFTIAKWYK